MGRKAWKKECAPEKGTTLVVGMPASPPSVHQVIYGALSVIRENLAVARHWSETWGHTKVLVHPDLSADFVFMPRISSFHKRGSKLSTRELINPRTLLENDENIGFFKLLLNERSMLIEGVILQVLRMLDELIWCRFWHLSQTLEIDRDLAYGLACGEVQKFGVECCYVSERDILLIRDQNPLTPLRLYGDIHKKGTIPFLIGGVINHDANIEGSPQIHVDTDAVSHICARALTRNKLLTNPVVRLRYRHTAESLSVNTPVMCGITLAKQLHVGHFLLLSLGGLVRTCISSKHPLYLESNDTGLRIERTVIRISKLTGRSSDETMLALSEEKINAAIIEYAYQTRHLTEVESDDAVVWVPKRPDHSLLFAMHQQVNTQLQVCGIAPTQIITDSWACHDSSLPELSAHSLVLARLGFSYVITERSGRGKRLIVIKHEGKETASGARAKAIQYVSRSAKGEKSVIYVDGDASIQDASVILEVNGISLSQLPGAAIGFCLEIASGTNSKALSVTDLFEEMKTLLSSISLKMSHVGTFFLLTRYSTARAKRIGVQSSVSQRGLHFFDYRNILDFKCDFRVCATECKVFVREVNLMVNKLSKDHEESNAPCTFAEQIASRMRRSLFSTDLGAIFPRSRPLKIEPIFRVIHNALVVRSRLNTQQAWDQICKAYVAGNKAPHDINVYLRRNELTYKSGSWADDMIPRSLLYADTLLRNGYTTEETLLVLPRYIYGDLCMLRLRCIYFDLICEVKTHLHILTKAPATLQCEIARGVSECMKRLGLEL